MRKTIIGGLTATTGQPSLIATTGTMTSSTTSEILRTSRGTERTTDMRKGFTIDRGQKVVQNFLQLFTSKLSYNQS
jgi:hypothetical protein